jgi:hypothetical protein
MIFKIQVSETQFEIGMPALGWRKAGEIISKGGPKENFP